MYIEETPNKLYFVDYLSKINRVYAIWTLAIIIQSYYECLLILNNFYIIKVTIIIISKEVVPSYRDIIF